MGTPRKEGGTSQGVLSCGLGQGHYDCRQSEEERLRLLNRAGSAGLRQGDCKPGMRPGLTVVTLRGLGTAQYGSSRTWGSE